MKKLLISVFALSYILNVAAETNLQDILQCESASPYFRNPKNALTKKVTPLTRADEDPMMFGYSFDLLMGMGLNEAYLPGVIEGAIEIPKEVAQAWKGSKVTAVNIGYGTSANPIVNIYITKDLEGEPVMMQEAEIQTQEGWNIIDLDTPYEIDGDAFYVGYQNAVSTRNDRPLGIDGVPTTLSYADIFAVYYGNEHIYDHLGTYGSVCLKIGIDGASMPDFGMLPETLYGDEVTGVGDPFDSYFFVVNTGKKPISSATVECKVGGEVVTPENILVRGDGSTTPEAYDYIPFGTVGMIYLEGIKSYVSGDDLPVDVKITGIGSLDGTSQTGDFGSLTSSISIYEETFERNVVVEEFTGTWCGNCPIGIVGMDYMSKNYGNDKFIGIAIHWDDEMQVNSYVEMLRYYNSDGSFPNAVINRVENIYPSADDLEAAYENYIRIKSPGKVELSCSYNEETKEIIANSTSTFGFNQEGGANYALAFVLTEDQVGPYVQINYFTGSQLDLDGWQNKPGYVSWYFDHVARNIWYGFGIDNSLPATIEKDKEYDFGITLPTSNVRNIDNCHVIVLLLNYRTGEILNAAQVSMAGAGVEELEAQPADGLYKVYNPQGIKVLETKDESLIRTLPAGIYIVNGKKVIL